MRNVWMMVLIVAVIAATGAGGCDENERLADYAQNSVDPVLLVAGFERFSPLSWR